MRPWPPTIAILLAGCSIPVAPDRPINPSLPITMAHADAVLMDAAAHPKRLRRPLLIVGGFADPGLGSRMLVRRFHEYTGDERIAAATLGFDQSWAECRRHIIDAADAAFPTDDPARTTEVDVIGISMGGLAARYAALPPGPGDRPSRRLRIARLFTLSSPLRGASLADAIPFNLHPLQGGMRSDSWLIRRIADAPSTWDDAYAVYSYVRLRDDQVGQANASVHGTTAWWVSSPPWPHPTHHASFLDRRILADVARRLRGETPLSSDPPAPFPTQP